MAYTLLGGFVVAVSAMPFHVSQTHLIVFKVQLDIIGDQREGEIHTATNLFITHQ